MGECCVPFLMDIARNKDITIFLEYYLDISKEYFDEGLISNNGVVLSKELTKKPTLTGMNHRVVTIFKLGVAFNE